MQNIYVEGVPALVKLRSTYWVIKQLNVKYVNGSFALNLVVAIYLYLFVISLATMDDFCDEEPSDVEQTNEEESEEEDDYYLSKCKAKRSGKVESSKNKGHPISQEEGVVAQSGKNSIEGEATSEVNIVDEDVHVSRRKLKTKAKTVVETGKEVTAPGAAGWTQKEQNQLETAMNSFSKETPKRWQLIAECVPSKTLVRFGCFLTFIRTTSSSGISEEPLKITSIALVEIMNHI